MARQKFDASLKDLSEHHAADWAPVLGASSVRRIRILDADVSTVTGAADKAMMIDSGGPEWVLHPEFVSGHELGLSHKMWWNNSVLHRRHACLVKSVAVLLRPAADGRHMTGLYELQFPDEAEPYHSFKFRVLRLWQMPVDQLLTGGIGILPVADDGMGKLVEVVARIDRRLKAEASPDEADKIASDDYNPDGAEASARSGSSDNSERVAGPTRGRLRDVLGNPNRRAGPELAGLANPPPFQQFAGIPQAVADRRARKTADLMQMVLISPQQTIYQWRASWRRGRSSEHLQRPVEGSESSASWNLRRPRAMHPTSITLPSAKTASQPL